MPVYIQFDKVTGLITGQVRSKTPPNYPNQITFSDLEFPYFIEKVQAQTTKDAQNQDVVSIINNESIFFVIYDSSTGAILKVIVDEKPFTDQYFIQWNAPVDMNKQKVDLKTLQVVSK